MPSLTPCPSGSARTRRIAVLAVALVACASAAGAQSASAAPDPLLTPAALRQDVAVLRQALETLHPGVYRYTSASALDRRLTELESRLSRGDVSLPEAFLAISEFTATLRCGHTFPNPNNQAGKVAQALFRATPRVPFYFRWLNGRMVVTRDASAEHDFPRGTEVLAINGVPSDAILARLLKYARTDGNNEAKKRANMSLLPSARWQAFDVYFPLVFAPPAGDWTFRVRRPGETVRTIASAPTDVAHRTAVIDSVTPARVDTTQPPWSFGIAPDGVATLTMSTWVTFNDSWDWKDYIDRAFAQMTERKATALVIDLRGNEGGTGVGDVILSHLVRRDVTLDQLARFTRYQRIPPTLRPYLDTWDRSFDDWGAAATPGSAPPDGGTTGFFRLTRFDDGANGTVIRPASPRFGGRVFVLVDADNSSATFEFALAMRQLKVGTLVGQPTGGNQRGINGGAFYFLRLPSSRIEVDLPLIGFYAPATRPNTGIAPDIMVRMTASDIARGRDPEMEAVRAQLRRR